MDPVADPSERPLAVLVQDFVDLSCSVPEVRERLCGPSGWLAGIAARAGGEGDALMTRIGPAWAHGLLAREVIVHLGPCRSRGTSVVVPVEWRAAEHSSLFPVLSGDLELDSLGGGLCRVKLSASYLPPLGALGRSIDRSLLHHVADSTVRSFLRQLAAALEAEAAHEMHAAG